MKTDSNLERVLGTNNLAVTAELGPPASIDGGIIKRKAGILKGYVDALNITDGQTAVVKMSSWASSIMVKEAGIEPITQMTTRDRNRIALQMDILGIAALGIKNILCLTGDHVSFGNHPQAKGVWDVDSIQFIDIVKRMRDKKEFSSGGKIDMEPSLFIGGVANPFIQPLDLRLLKLKKKVQAGVDFIQTQSVFNINAFKEWMKGVRNLGIHKEVKILAGITPIRTLRSALYMKNKVPGLELPDSIINRISGLPEDKIPEEGVRIALETIQEVRNIEGVAGIHIMAINWEEIVPEIIEKAGLYPRP